MWGKSIRVMPISNMTRAPTQSGVLNSAVRRHAFSSQAKKKEFQTASGGPLQEIMAIFLLFTSSLSSPPSWLVNSNPDCLKDHARRAWTFAVGASIIFVERTMSSPQNKKKNGHGFSRYHVCGSVVQSSCFLLLSVRVCSSAYHHKWFSCSLVSVYVQVPTNTIVSHARVCVPCR